MEGEKRKGGKLGTPPNFLLGTGLRIEEKSCPSGGRSIAELSLFL